MTTGAPAASWVTIFAASGPARLGGHQLAARRQLPMDRHRLAAAPRSSGAHSLIGGTPGVSAQFSVYLSCSAPVVAP